MKTHTFLLALLFGFSSITNAQQIKRSFFYNGATNEYTVSQQGTFQEFTIPVSGQYLLEANGAQGGSSGSGQGGKGASLRGYIQLQAGDVLRIGVGGAGLYGLGTVGGNGANMSGGGGGGATSIVLVQGNQVSPLMVAGGGGGAGTANDGVGGRISQNGSSGNTNGGNAAGAGGTNGGGGATNGDYRGGAGGGGGPLVNINFSHDKIASPSPFPLPFSVSSNSSSSVSKNINNPINDFEMMKKNSGKLIVVKSEEVQKI